MEISLNLSRIVKVLGSLIILELVGGGIYLTVLPQIQSSRTSQVSVTPLPETTARLDFKAPSEEIKVGRTFTVPITLKLSQPAVISVVDSVISFDPSRLQVVGVAKEETTTPRFELPVNVVDTTSRRILLTWYTQAPQPIKNEITLGTVTFKSLAAGETELKLEASAEDAKSSSVFPMNSEKDILSEAGSLTITIVK